MGKDNRELGASSASLPTACSPSGSSQQAVSPASPLRPTGASEIDSLRAQLESANGEAAKYHRIAMNNLDEVARLRDALKNIEARVATLVMRALDPPNNSRGES